MAIEASNPSADPDPGMASVAGARLTADGQPGEIIEIAYEAGSRERDGLLPAIDAVRTAFDVPRSALDRVCVSLGPGGYTGLRVSVTVAKTLAHATGASLTGIPSAIVAIGEDRPETPFCVCLASKGTRTHVTAFMDSDRPDGEPIGVLDAAGLLDWYRTFRQDRGPDSGEMVLVADRFLPEPIRAACLQSSGRILAPRFSATRCLLAGAGRSSADPFGLMPIYAREPEAVRLWRERRGGNA